MVVFSVFSMPDAMNLCLTLITHGFEDIGFSILKSFNIFSRDNVDQGNFFLQHCVNSDTVRSHSSFLIHREQCISLIRCHWAGGRWDFAHPLKNKRRMFHTNSCSELKFAKELWFSCVIYIHFLNFRIIGYS